MSPSQPSSNRAHVVYVLNQTVLASGRVFERGTAGTAQEFGEAFHPLRTAGYLTPVDLNYQPLVDRSRFYKTLQVSRG